MDRLVNFTFLANKNFTIEYLRTQNHVLTFKETGRIKKYFKSCFEAHLMAMVRNRCKGNVGSNPQDLSTLSGSKNVPVARCW